MKQSRRALIFIALLGNISLYSSPKKNPTRHHKVAPYHVNLLQELSKIILNPLDQQIVAENIENIFNNILVITENTLNDMNVSFEEINEKLFLDQIAKRINKNTIIHQARRTNKKRDSVQRCQHCQECEKCSKEKIKDESKKESKIIIGNFMNMLGNFGNIVQDPNNPHVVGSSITNMFGSLVNIAFQIMKKNNQNNFNSISKNIAHSIYHLS